MFESAEDDHTMNIAPARGLRIPVPHRSTVQSNVLSCMQGLTLHRTFLTRF